MISIIESYLPFIPSSEYYWNFSIGTVFIVIYCIGSFNRPSQELLLVKTEQTYLLSELTGTSQFISAFAIYCGICIGLYALVCALGPKPLGLILSSLTGASIPSTVGDSIPLYIALLVPSVDKINVAEQWIRTSLHRHASIPFALRRLARKLYNDPPSQANNSPHTSAASLLLQEDRLDGCWRRLCNLSQKWEIRDDLISGKYSEELVNKYILEFESIQRDIEQLKSDIESSPKDQITRKHLHNRAEGTIIDFSYLIAASIVKKCGTSRSKQDAVLRKLGYPGVAADIPSGTGTLLGGILFVFLVVYAFVTAMNNPSTAAIVQTTFNIDSLQGWPTSSSIALLSIIPLLCRQAFLAALIPFVAKRAFIENTNSHRTERLFQSATSIFLIATVPHAVFLLLLFNQKISVSVHDIASTWPFLLESFLCGSVLFYLLQLRYDSAPLTRLAAASRIAAYSIIYTVFLSLVGYIASSQYSEHAGYVGFYVVSCLIIGGSISFIIFLSVYTNSMEQENDLLPGSSPGGAGMRPAQTAAE